MKKIVSLIAFLLISYVGFSQTKGISYQAVIIDPNPIQIPGSDITGQPYVSKEVWIRFGIYAGTTLQYEELHKTKTDEFGLVNLIIGAGVNTGKAGTFTSLNWDGVTKNIITNVSFDQGGSYTEVSNQKFTYVPYTLLAETAVKLAGVLPIASGGTGATNAIAARANLGLGNVDNTADQDKPVSIPTLAILDTKESLTNKSINIIADSASSVKYPSVKAIKDYIDNQNAILAQLAKRAKLADKATALETPRTINGIPFDGSANIIIPIVDADATTKGIVQIAGDLTGTASAPTIAAAAVTTAKMADGAVTDAKITSVSGSKVMGNIAGNATNVTGMVAMANGGTGATTATGALTNLGAEAVANKSTDLTADANSTLKYPSVKLIKDYVDTRVAAAGVSDGSITSAKIADATIVSADIATNAGITNAQLANSSLNIGSTSISLGGTTSSLAGLSSVASTNFTGALIGNANTATKLAATKSINGVAFDGSSDITVTANANTLTGSILASNVLNSSLTSVGTITAGTWNGSTIAVANGGTGLTSLAAGNILFGNGTSALGTSSNLFWDNATGRLGVGTSTPGNGLNTKLDVVGRASFRTVDANGGIILDGSGNYVRIYSDAISGTPKDFVLGTYPNGHMNQLYLKQSNGFVGILKANPTTALDVNGTVTASGFTGPLTGNASTATALVTPRTISTTGDILYTSTGFDGSADVTGIATLANSGVTSGTYGSSTAIPALTIDSKGRITNATTTSIIAGVNSVTAIATSSNVNGATISGTTITLTPADANNGGVITTGAQTFAGDKTFYNDLMVNGLSVGLGKGSGNYIYNTSVGRGALGSNTTGWGNTGLGYSALGVNTTGEGNTAIGFQGQMSGSGASANTSMGFAALIDNSSGSNNTAIGYQSLQKNNGSGNISIGSNTMYRSTGANTNIAIGNSVLDQSTNAANNVIIGNDALTNAGNASNNVIVGYSAGTGTSSGTYNTLIGNGANTGSAGLTNAMALGNGAIVNANNTIQLGNSSVTSLITSATISATGFTGPLTGNVTGNASTATKLAASKSINGVAFDGSADITIAANSTTLTGTTLANNIVSSSLTSVGMITSGTWSATEIAIAKGGTGATTATDALTNLGAEAVANRSTDITMGGLGATDSKYPTQLAVKTYVSNQFASGGVADGSITNAKLYGGIDASKLIGTDIATVGTITTGTWSGSTIAIAKGGTGATSAAAALTNLGAEATANKSDNTSLGSSTSLFPTQNAVKTYVDTKVAAATIADADVNTKGKIQLAGDLGNTAASPSVLTVGGSSASNIHAAELVANAATDANTVSTIVKRNSAGDFSAGTITASIVGNVTGNVSGTAANVTGIVVGANGGTGINNGSKTMTIGGDFVTSGTGALSLTYSGTTNVTLPSTGTLATITGSENLSNKTINGLSLNSLSTGFSISGGTISKTLTIADNATLSGTNTGDQTITLTGDVTGSGTGSFATSLANSGVTAGQYGSATTAPNITVDAKGRITSVTNTTITGVSPIGSSLTNGNIFMGSGGVVTAVPITGDFTINSSGVGTISATSVTNNMLAGGIDLTTKVSGALPVANGGTGATSLTGYVKGNGTSAFTSSTSIPVADITGAVVKVNGVQPDGTGNVTVPTVAVITGTLTSFTTLSSGSYTGTSGTTFVVSQDGASNNGRTFIFDGTNTWHEITTNQAATDSRYLIKSGDSMTGALTVPSMTITNAPASSTDATTKSYVDNLVTNATPSATSSITGKIQLAGDLGGSATLPTVVTVGGAAANDIASATSLANAATYSNTANSIVRRDVSGNFSAGTITASLVGNVTGNVSGNAANVTGVVAVANGGSGASTLTGYIKGNGTSAYTASATIPVADVTNAENNSNKSSATDLGGVSANNTKYPTQLAVKSYVDSQVAAATIADADASTKGKIQLTGDLGNTASSPTVVSVGGSSASNINAATILANAATATNTASAIVRRDASGNFNAGTITANLTGTASKATILATGRTIASTGDVSYTSGSFDGSANVTGIATLANSGVVSGTYGSSTAIPSLTIDSKGRITSATTTSIIAGVNTVGSISGVSDPAGATISGTTITLTPADATNGGVVTTGTQTFAGAKTFNSTITGSVSGNAGTATKLQTARTIGITGDMTFTSPSFDGSTNITGTGTLTNTGVTAGTYGSSTAIPSLTIDAKGRVTNATTTSIIAGVNTVASIAGTSNANGATISGTTITLTPADGTNGGVITSGAQTLAGVKTFSNNTAATSTSSGAVIVTGGLGVGGAIYGGSIQNTPIGSTTASTGAFTTLSASGATTLSSTSAHAGAATFSSTVNVVGATTLTSLTASGTATLTSLTTTGAATFSSTVTIPTGAGLNKVLTSDANGGATWNANPNSAFKLVSTATYTVSATDDKYVIYTNAATGTISLPAITSTMSGKEIIIKNISNFNVTISANGSQKIVADFANNTATSATLGVEASNNWVRLIADGTNSQWILFRALF